MSDFLELQVQIYQPQNTSWVDITEYCSSVEINKGNVSGVGTATVSDGLAESCDLTIQNTMTKTMNPTMKTGKLKSVVREQIDTSGGGTQFSVAHGDIQRASVFVKDTDTEYKDIGVTGSGTTVTFSQTINAGAVVYVTYTYYDETEDNEFNMISGVYSPLLWENRKIRVREIRDVTTNYHVENLLITPGVYTYTPKLPSNLSIVPGTITLNYVKGISWDDFTSAFDTYDQPFGTYTENSKDGFISQKIIVNSSGDIEFKVIPTVAEYVEVQYQTVNTEERNQTEIFEGFIDKVSFDYGTISVFCLDNTKILKEAYIHPGALRDYTLSGTNVTDVRNSHTYTNGIPMEDLIQNCLDDYFGVGVHTFYVEDTPNWSLVGIVGEIAQYTTLHELFQEIAVSRGAYIGYKYQKSTDAYELTFKDIDRGASLPADHTITWTDDMKSHNMDIDGETLRNMIICRYYDTGDENPSEVASVNVDGSSYWNQVTVASDGYTISHYGINTKFSIGDYIILVSVDNSYNTEFFDSEYILSAKKILIKRIIDIDSFEAKVVSKIETPGLYYAFRQGSNIDDNGLRVALVEEDKASMINEVNEALSFTSRLYKDTARIFNLTNITTKPRGEILPLDIVSVVNPKMESEIGQKYYVEAVKHSYDFKGKSYSTTIQGNAIRGRAGRQKIQEIQARPGEWSPVTSKKMNDLFPEYKPVLVCTSTVEITQKTILGIGAYFTWNTPFLNITAKHIIQLTETQGDYSDCIEHTVLEANTLLTDLKRNTKYYARVITYMYSGASSNYSEEIEFTTIQGDGVYITNQEEFEAWLDSLYREDYKLIDYSYTYIYGKSTPYTYNMEHWFTTDRLGTIESTALTVIYVTGDVSLFEVSDYIKIGSDIRRITDVNTTTNVITVDEDFSSTYEDVALEYVNTFIGLQRDGEFSLIGVDSPKIKVTYKRTYYSDNLPYYRGKQVFLCIKSRATTVANLELYLIDNCEVASNFVSSLVGIYVDDYLEDVNLKGLTTKYTKYFVITSGDISVLKEGQNITFGYANKYQSSRIVEIDVTGQRVYVDDFLEFGTTASLPIYVTESKNKCTITNNRVTYDYANSTYGVGASAEGIKVISNAKMDLLAESNYFNNFNEFSLALFGNFRNIRIKYNIFNTVTEQYNSDFSAIDIRGGYDYCNIQNNWFKNMKIKTRVTGSIYAKYRGALFILNNEFTLTKKTKELSSFVDIGVWRDGGGGGTINLLKVEGNKIYNSSYSDHEGLKGMTFVSIDQSPLGLYYYTDSSVTLTDGSPIVTNLSRTDNLFVGQVVEIYTPSSSVGRLYTIESTGTNQITLTTDVKIDVSPYNFYFNTLSTTSDNYSFYSYASMVNGSTTVTLSSALGDTHYLKVGDTLLIDEIVYTIDSITDLTHFELTSAFTSSTGTYWVLNKKVVLSNGYIIDNIAKSYNRDGSEFISSWLDLEDVSGSMENVSISSNSNI